MVDVQMMIVTVPNVGPDASLLAKAAIFSAASRIICRDAIDIMTANMTIATGSIFVKPET